MMLLHLSFLVVLCFGQSVVEETEPNDNTPDGAYEIQMYAPVRIEGTTDATDVDYYFVYLSAGLGPSWTLNVYDSCSTAECTVAPAVTLSFTDCTTMEVVNCVASWTITTSQLVAIQVEQGQMAGGYGLVITSDSYDNWDGNCGAEQTVVFEVEPDDVTPQTIRVPLRVQGNIISTDDLDRYQLTVTTTGNYSITTVPYSCYPAVRDTCAPDTNQPQISARASGIFVDSTIDVTTACPSIIIFVNAGDVLYINVTAGSTGYTGGYGLVVQNNGVFFTYSCLNYNLDIPSPPADDSLGRWICSNPGGANRFEQAIGTLSVPFYVANANLASDDEEDFYYIGVTGGLYTFIVLGEQPRTDSCVVDSCEFDTVMTIYDAAGTRIGGDDDVGDSLCSGFYVELGQGNYYIVITSFGASSSGTYSLLGFLEAEASVFLDQIYCPNTGENGGICPIGNGSGIASGDIPVYGNYYGDYWWVILIILGVIFLFPLVVFFIYMGMTYGKPLPTTTASINSMAPPVTSTEVPETNRDDSAIELSAMTSENVDSPNWR